jgi:hypothetical protein
MSTLFDYQEGLRLADEGMIAALDNAGTKWEQAADQAVRTVARLRVTFTADEVWDYVHHHNLPEPPNRAALGAVFKSLSRAGVIRQTGEWRNSQRPETHTRPLRVWQAV